MGPFKDACDGGMPMSFPSWKQLQHTPLEGPLGVDDRGDSWVRPCGHHTCTALFTQATCSSHALCLVHIHPTRRTRTPAHHTH